MFYNGAFLTIYAVMSLFQMYLNYILCILVRLKYFNKRHHGRPGGRLNKKDGLTRYGDSHVKDKTS